MSVAYFDASGTLLCISMTLTGLPERTAYHCELPDETMPNDIYFDTTDEIVRQRAALEIGVARNLISGIPPGSVVIADGQALVVDDGRIEFEADVEAVIRVLVDHPHFISQAFEVPTGPGA